MMTTPSSYVSAPATQLVATRCAVCGRELLDAESVESGVGPVCRKATGLDARSLFPNWDGVREALSAEEYEALEIDKRRPLYDDHATARFVANRLVYRIACDQKGPDVASRTLALHALGYTALAHKIAERLGAVRVEEDGDHLVVKAPMNEDFISSMRRVPGARWVPERKARLVPVTERKRLWQVIRAVYPGFFVLGKRLAIA